MSQATKHAAALAVYRMMCAEGYAPDTAREYTRRAMEACGFRDAAALGLADDAEAMFDAQAGTLAAQYRDAAVRSLGKGQ